MLNERFKKMIIEEEEKKEEKNERLLVDLCKCHISLNYLLSPEMISICVSCLLKVALKKEETDEAQKEVEMGLLALCNIGNLKVKIDLYLNEIREIIKYHQEHQNLTRLAYQSVWLFLVKRLYCNRFLEDIVVNKLHFGREARRELEELTKCVNWKKKEEEMNKEEAKEEIALMRWVETLKIYFLRCKLWNELFFGLICGIVQVYRAAKGNNGVIGNLCISSLGIAAERSVVKVEDLLKSGAIDAVLEEIHQPTLDDNIAHDSLIFFMNVSSRLKEKTDNKIEEEERKATKRKVFEKLEEEGYEDTITTFHKIFDFLHRNYSLGTSLNISDYFINI
ncbi:uncharacterized protein MONOS_14294 [Monocercomonoides exilis]|uniref:uncharacterized protein n=1 Tax=Monocercomonoides exilis TaxID=2049356 RepID=UPI00355AC5EE|nr:hypothetical protein MONOS_14294 [Monocercomonoides exilis]|eukprot:MONOS_14294.1-p1 / transcript=MONOS_14294.1 / gene=MONOS_14294 / organism=Monocercomonoides_exilis_PA203 / gene_product=unspecified product / transcript_product=unspecified product / location=Mono_scaffold00973:7417-8486(-) / protein_length=336 / sequence_SO=supercontig / SO=protein_coding / is_pseudo=false